MLFSTVGGFSILCLLIYVCISFSPKYFHLSSPGVSAVLQLTLRIIRVLQLRVRDEGCFLRWEVKYISRSGSGSPYLANTNYAVCFQPRWKLCWLKNWEFWAVNAAFIHLFSYFLLKTSVFLDPGLDTVDSDSRRVPGASSWTATWRGTWWRW